MSLSPLILERPGRWRLFGLVCIVIISFLPALPLVLAATGQAPTDLFSKFQGFLPLLLKSLVLSLSGAAMALCLGLFAGVFYSLYEFPGRKLFMFLFLLPIMVPPLLWSVGINNLATVPALGYLPLHGPPAFILVTVMVTFPLVTASTVAICSGLTSSQCDAARMASGEGRLFMLATRFSLPPAAVASCLGGFLMLSSPGPAMGLGIKTAVSEILVSFSALYDMRLAAAQCLLLSVSTLFIAILVLAAAGTRSMELLSPSSRAVEPVFHKRMSFLATLYSGTCCLLLVVFPACGLLIPAIAWPDVPAMVGTLSRTLPYTLFYAAGSAAVATVLGFTMAFFMGRFPAARFLGTVSLLLIFSMPASLTALGFVYAGARSPAWTDFMFRSPLAVCLAQGVHLFPVPAVLAARFFGSMPQSWPFAAELQGISLGRFAMRILAPLASVFVLTGFVLTLLLSAADTGTVLLIHPPGAQNLPLAIFTIMANAPENQVAQLCLLYLVLASVLLLLVSAVWNKGKSWKPA